jgi:hypothetical protein
MLDRRVTMKMDSREGKVMEVTTGVPQGSPVSPILFVIYISELFKKIERSVEGTLAHSFVDEVAWVVEGDDVTQCAQRMQRCASRATRWAEENAVEFDIEKTEAILFSKKRNHQGSNVKLKFRIRESRVAFDKKPTRWLKVQLDRKLRFQHHHEVVMTKARKAQGRVKSITRKYRLNPANARKFQTAAVQSIALYGSELWWDNQTGREQDLQKLVKESARHTTGMFRTTPLVPLVKEAAFRPAVSPLNLRRRRFAKHFIEMPDGHGGGHIMEGESGLAKRLRKCLNIRGKVEQNTLPEYKVKAEAKVIICEKKQVLKEANVVSSEDGLVYWTDGSRFDDGRVGCAVVWREQEGGEWRSER